MLQGDLMHRIATLLILTLFMTTAAVAAQPEQDEAPLREKEVGREPLKESEGYSPAPIFSVDSELEIEVTNEEVDHQLVELREVSQPDLSETGNWEWMSQQNQLVLDALDPQEVEASQPTVEKSEPSPYDSLAITAEDRKTICKLLMTMAENNVFKLLIEKKRLEQWGDEIYHVHPVRFLGTVFTDPRLIYFMREIRRSSFKWDGFVEGFAERMREEASRNNLVRYVDGFAEAVQRDSVEIYPFFEKADFEGLVKYLLKN